MCELLSAVFGEVYCDSYSDDYALDDLLPHRRHVDELKAILNDCEDQHSHHYASDFADTSAHGYASDHARSYSVSFVAVAVVVGSSCGSCSLKHSSDAVQE